MLEDWEDDGSHYYLGDSTTEIALKTRSINKERKF